MLKKSLLSFTMISMACVSSFAKDPADRKVRYTAAIDHSPYSVEPINHALSEDEAKGDQPTLHFRDLPFPELNSGKVFYDRLKRSYLLTLQTDKTECTSKSEKLPVIATCAGSNYTLSVNVTDFDLEFPELY